MFASSISLSWSCQENPFDDKEKRQTSISMPNSLQNVKRPKSKECKAHPHPFVASFGVSVRTTYKWQALQTRKRCGNVPPHRLRCRNKLGEKKRTDGFILRQRLTGDAISMRLGLCKERLTGLMLLRPRGSCIFVTSAPGHTDRN